MNNNFIVKTVDAKLSDIQNALKQAGITVKSIVEIYKEEEKSEEVK